MGCDWVLHKPIQIRLRCLKPFDCYHLLFVISNEVHSSFFDKEISFPPDYTVQVLTCLQALLHAFLLPFGQSKSALIHGAASRASIYAADATDSSQKSASNGGLGDSARKIELIPDNPSGIPEVAPDAHMVAKIIGAGTAVGMPEGNTQPLIVTVRQCLHGLVAKVSGLMVETNLTPENLNSGLEEIVIAYTASSVRLGNIYYCA